MYQPGIADQEYINTFLGMGYEWPEAVRLFYIFLRN
jgi:hypothetical protein